MLPISDFDVTGIVSEYLKKLDSDEINDRYFTDVALWCHDRLGIDLWYKQVEASDAVVNNKNVAIKAGHGVGKSFWAAMLCCWWIDTRPIERVFVATTAPSADQVTGILWREIRKAYQLSHSLAKQDPQRYRPLPGYITQDNKWKDDLGNIIAQGRKPPDNKAEDAFQGFHDGHVLAIGDEACHDDQTEVLTDSGWKLFRDVSSSDLLMTMNEKTGKSQYEKPVRMIAKNYTGKMLHYASAGADFKVTPDHRMVYYSTALGYDGPLLSSTAEEMTFSNKMVPRHVNWTGDSSEVFTLPEYRGERKLFSERALNALDWARFCGWHYSEGSINKSLNTVSIWQSAINVDNRNEIRELLNRLGFNYSEYEDQFAIHDSQLARYLVKSGRTCDVKRLGPEVLSWSPERLSVLLDSYVKGDGYSRRGRDIIYTSCKEMADDLQEAILKTGFSSRVSSRGLGDSQPLADGRVITSSRDGWVVTRQHKSTMLKLVKHNQKWVDYDGTVYCATMPENHTLLTRRNGYAIWTGNCGLSGSMIDGLANITSNNNSRRVVIGNPTNPLSYFGKIFKEDTGAWILQTISVMDSPNFHGRGRCTCHANEPVGLGMSADALSKLTNDEYVEDKKKEYGEDSPRYKSRVLGEFAYDAGNTLFSEFDLAQAMNAVVFPDLDDPYRVLGVDIARMGQDSTYVYMYERGTVQATHPETNEPLGTDLLSEDTHEVIRGGKLRQVGMWKDAPFISREIEDKFGNLVLWKGSAERIHELAMSLAVEEVRVDASGLGHGVIDPLFVLARGRYRIVEIWGSGETPDKRAYHNQRAYQYSEMRRQMFQGTIDIDPKDEQLIDELGGIQYGFSATSGGMLIESKEAMKKRGIHSPDAADAAWYACMDTEHLDGPQAGDIITQDWDENLYEQGDWYSEKSYAW